MPYDVICFSPHLDDAVLSCCAKLSQDIKNGRQVLVVTIFDRGDDNEKRRIEYAARHKEDANALHKLGADSLLLDFKDAPIRDARYDLYENMHLDPWLDKPLIWEVVSTVQKLIDENPSAELLFPLGVGSHIDHRLTFAVSQNLRGIANMVFYEDKPYLFVEHFLNIRLQELDLSLQEPAPADLQPLLGSSLIKSFVESFRTILLFRKVPPAGISRFRNILKWCRRFNLSSPSGTQKLAIAYTVTESDVLKMSALVNCYPSQVEGMFGDIQHFTELNNRLAKRYGMQTSYVERYWKVST